MLMQTQTVPDDITATEAKELVLALPDNPPWWYLLNPNVIPKMTNPMGVHWDQPSAVDISISDDCAAMDEDTLRDLPDYTYTLPTGAYAGKMWRRFVDGKGWCLVWYGYSEKGPNFCSINCRKILT
jgi:hypothetical protein